MGIAAPKLVSLILEELSVDSIKQLKQSAKCEEKRIGDNTGLRRMHEIIL